jgi:isopropylmalate/homocitrate/citramalate synthase
MPIDHTSSEIELDPNDRWWVSRLNRLPEVQVDSAMPHSVRIRDCTLREGEETPGTQLTIGQKLSLARAIEKTGIQEIEIGYAGAVAEHQDLARRIRDEGIKLKLASVNRAYARDGEWQAEIDRAVKEGVDSISLVVFMNEDLLTSVPWLDRADVPQRVTEVVAYARTSGVEVAPVLAGASRTQLSAIHAFAEAAVAGGADVVGLADSMGCALPETVSYLVRYVRQVVGPQMTVAFHGHDTFGLATANTLAALRAGASIVDAVPLGLGEGAGIAPLEELVFALEILYGVDTGLEIERVAELCREVKLAFGVEYLPTKSIVGDGLFRHSIDSHIASILRGKWHSWECFQPSVVGQKRRLEFGFAKIRQGRSGAIAAKIDQMGLSASDEQLDSIIEQVRAITVANGWANEAEVEAVVQATLAQPSGDGRQPAG